MYKVKKVKKDSSSKISFFNVFLGIMAIVMAGSIVFSYLSLNELNLKVQKAQKELDSLESQEEVMNVNINKKTSLDNIENIAVNKLGMVKVENYRVRYINLVNKDNVEILEEEKGDSSILDGIVANFNILLEYLK